MSSDSNGKIVTDVDRSDEAIAGVSGYVLQDVFQANADALLTACALALTTIDACAQDDGTVDLEHLEEAQCAFSWLHAALRDMCELSEDAIRPMLYDRMVEIGTAQAGAM